MKKLPNSCPVCGSTEFYVSQKVSGYSSFIYYTDEREPDYSPLYEGLDTSKTGIVRCNECNHLIAKRFNIKNLGE